ncbi:hypothetical protein D031_2212B, partial [Vibrio parahaemolyticus VP-48]
RLEPLKQWQHLEEVAKAEEDPQAQKHHYSTSNLSQLERSQTGCRLGRIQHRYHQHGLQPSLEAVVDHKSRVYLRGRCPLFQSR